MDDYIELDYEDVDGFFDNETEETEDVEDVKKDECGIHEDSERGDNVIGLQDNLDTRAMMRPLKRLQMEQRWPWVQLS